MDLNYDYGDVIHTHKHIHTKPDSHRQVVEHALKEWCHDYFGDEANEKCTELNEIQHHDITDGGHDDLKVSDIYLIITDLQKLNGDYEDTSISSPNPNEYNINFKGSKVDIKIPDASNPNNFDIKIKKEEGFFKIIIELSPNVIEIREDGLYLEEEGQEIVKLSSKEAFPTGVVKNLKQTLRNLDLTKLESRIVESEKEVEIQKKNLKNKLHKKGDEFGVERKLDLMERIKKEKKMELIVLVILFIIGILFGIFCIYTQFQLEL